MKKRSWGVRGILRGLRGVLSQNTPYPLKRMSFIKKIEFLKILVVSVWLNKAFIDCKGVSKTLNKALKSNTTKPRLNKTLLKHR
ncbi:hypothetical protein EXS93_06450 [Helicobacter pylori]|nr:hypothetical protein [Helicobacter pylori]